MESSLHAIKSMIGDDQESDGFVFSQGLLVVSVDHSLDLAPRERASVATMEHPLGDIYDEFNLDPVIRWFTPTVIGQDNLRNSFPFAPVSHRASLRQVPNLASDLCVSPVCVPGRDLRKR